MKTSAFFEALPALFTPDVQSGDPVDGSWKGLASQVAGYTAVNELAVLNEAARHLPEGEAYLEVGTFKGRSICAAVRGNAGKKFVVMENFMEFGMAGEMAREELMTNLAEHASDADVELLEGDCFKLMVEPGALDRPVGVYFYDGEHTLLSHYLALAAVEPEDFVADILADPAARAEPLPAEHPDPGEREGGPRRRPPRRPRRHGQRQRPEHLERHGHALRDPRERLVDGQVHAGHGRAQPDDGGPPPGAQAGEGGAARPGDEQQHGRGEHHAQGDHGGRADVVEQQARHGRAELLAQQ